MRKEETPQFGVTELLILFQLILQLQTREEFSSHFEYTVFKEQYHI